MKKSLIFAGLLLLTAGAFVVYGNMHVPEPTFYGKLTDLLPPPSSGWKMTTREIADTPEMKEAVGEILNYDDGVFVDYVSGVNRISVYIAYWTPGKMSHRLVAGHTPDICWVNSGWKKELSGQREDIRAGGLLLPTGEDRLFTASGRPEYVWFWHVVGARIKSYSTGHNPPWYASVTDLIEKGLNQREEQFFIRISSQVALDTPALQPQMEKILSKLPLPTVNPK